MNSLILNEAPRDMAVECSDDELRVSLTGGQGIHWPAVDEDISVMGLLAGQRSVESRAACLICRRQTNR